MMINFEKIDSMLILIENNEIPENKNFNEFAIEFYTEVKLLPLSKYLKSKNRTSKTPKIMNIKKAGELLKFTLSDDEMLSFLKRKGFSEVPLLDYKSIMLLRKIDPIDNWKKIIDFLNGNKTIEEINSSTKPILLPQEIKILEDEIKKELKIDEDEFEKLMRYFNKILKDKKLLKAIKKLSR